MQYNICLWRPCMEAAPIDVYPKSAIGMPLQVIGIPAGWREPLSSASGIYIRTSSLHLPADILKHFQITCSQFPGCWTLFDRNSSFYGLECDTENVKFLFSKPSCIWQGVVKWGGHWALEEAEFSKAAKLCPAARPAPHLLYAVCQPRCKDEGAWSFSKLGCFPVTHIQRPGEMPHHEQAPLPNAHLKAIYSLFKRAWFPLCFCVSVPWPVSAS